ncbi:hypothetical protein SLA2020_452420 [Shorea laevis]
MTLLDRTSYALFPWLFLHVRSWSTGASSFCQHEKSLASSQPVLLEPAVSNLAPGPPKPSRITRKNGHGYFVGMERLGHTPEPIEKEEEAALSTAPKTKRPSAGLGPGGSVEEGLGPS